MRGSSPEASEPEPASRFEFEPCSAASQARPRRVAVRVVKAAGAELGLFFTERGGHLEVTGYQGALADAIARDAAKVVEGDRLYEVNDVGGDPAVLRDALAASRTASSLVLVFERKGISGGDIAAALRGLEDLAPQILREGGGRAQPALVASMLRLADEAGEREQVLETLDLSARALSEVLFLPEFCVRSRKKNKLINKYNTEK